MASWGSPVAAHMALVRSPLARALYLSKSRSSLASSASMPAGAQARASVCVSAESPVRAQERARMRASPCGCWAEARRRTFRHAVSVDARAVAQRVQHHRRAVLIHRRAREVRLERRHYGALLRGEEARPHDHPRRAHRQRGRELPPRARAAAHHHRRAQLGERLGEEHPRAHEVALGVAGDARLEASDLDKVHANGLRLESVRNRGHLAVRGRAQQDRPLADASLQCIARVAQHAHASAQPLRRVQPKRQERGRRIAARARTLWMTLTPAARRRGMNLRGEPAEISIAATRSSQITSTYAL